MPDSALNQMSSIVPPFLKVAGLDSQGNTDLEAKIKDVAEREKMVFKRGSAPLWAFVVYDFNRIHLFKGNAGQFGFHDTPVYGTWIAARAEQYVLELLDEVNGLNGRALNYVGHSIKFKKPFYPGKKANWNLTRAVEVDGGLDISISAVDKSGVVIVQCPEINLRTAMPEPRADDIVPFSSQDVKMRKNTEITPEELEIFYKCLRKKTNERIPMMYPAAFMISGLLDLSSRRTGKPEGGFAGVDFKFYNAPGFGPVETAIRVSDPTEKAGVYFYPFESLCAQAGKPLLSGRGLVYTKIKFLI